MKRFTRIEPTTVQEVGDKFKRQVVIKRFRTEDGLIHEFTTFGREAARHGGFIAVTDDLKVITTYQFRAGPEEWLYEIPGGGFRDGEDYEEAAIRELKEESGYVTEKIEYLGKSTRDAYMNGEWHYFLATGCTLAKDGADRDKEENEQGVETCLVTIDEFIENAKKNRMSDPHAVLMAYDRLIELKQEGK